MRHRRHRNLLVVGSLLAVTVLAAPAWGGDHLSFHLSSHGFGLSVGSSDWWVYGSTWHNPHWSVSYDTALSGYGEWIWVTDLGRVWRPYVDGGWRPFTHGRWVWTYHGWTWVSYEPWGYFPHHYGHWAYSYHGWVWAPGYTYHPARVAWVHWGGYVGWYPSAPRGWSHHHRGYPHGYSHGYRDGYHHGSRHAVHDAEHATYVPWNHLGSNDVSRHAVNSAGIRRANPGAASRSATSAPTRRELQRRGADRIPEATLTQRELVIGNRTVTVARPEGMERSVERNARRTVERALDASAIRRANTSGNARPRTTAARSESNQTQLKRETRRSRPQRAASKGRAASAPQSSRAQAEREIRRSGPQRTGSESRTRSTPPRTRAQTERSTATRKATSQQSKLRPTGRAPVTTGDSRLERNRSVDKGSSRSSHRSKTTTRQPTVQRKQTPRRSSPERKATTSSPDSRRRNTREGVSKRGSSGTRKSIRR
jgi:hypothetical protein